jgi:mono/diheme cytochrome c family protein
VNGGALGGVGEARRAARLRLVASLALLTAGCGARPDALAVVAIAPAASSAPSPPDAAVPLAGARRERTPLESPAARPALTDAAVLERAAVAAAEGGALWKSTCAVCHGAEGQGLIGPSLTDDVWLHGDRPAEIYETIARGVPSRGMPAWEPVLGADKVRTLAAFVHGRLARPAASKHP